MHATPGQFRMRLAADILHGGGVLAYPTEAVYGLGCDPFDARAVQRLLLLKRRPVEKGLIVVASRPEQLAPLLGALTPAQRAQLDASWPGPNTWVLPNRGFFPVWITGGPDRVAVRVSAHPVVQALCDAFGGPLVSTSANRAGRPPARTTLAVRLRFGAELDAIVSGDTGGAAKPTIIRDLETGRVLRPS